MGVLVMEDDVVATVDDRGREGKAGRDGTGSDEMECG